PLAAPPWWHLDVVGRDRESDKPEPERRTRPKKKVEAQLTLPDVMPPAKQQGAHPLADSELFRKRVELARAKLDEILAATTYLLDRHGVAPADAFAGALGKHATRVEGFVAALGEVL